jgi:hypothetical protein
MQNGFRVSKLPTVGIFGFGFVRRRLISMKNSLLLQGDKDATLLNTVSLTWEGLEPLL